MSDEKVLCSHTLTIRFDQFENGQIDWFIEPDEKVANLGSLSPIELAIFGAPLSLIGMRALWKLCGDGIVFHVSNCTS